MKTTKNVQKLDEHGVPVPKVKTTGKAFKDLKAGSIAKNAARMATINAGHPDPASKKPATSKPKSNLPLVDRINQHLSKSSSKKK